MSIDLNQLYCSHNLKNDKLKKFCKTQFESFVHPDWEPLTCLDIKDSIHYNTLITNNYETYEEYINITDQKEHSVDTFINLKKNFDINKMEKIKIRYNFKHNKFIIEDGVHRLSILLYKKIINNKVPVKYLNIIQDNCFYFVIYEHGINYYDAICDIIEKSNIRIDKKIKLELSSHNFTNFIYDIYPDNNKNHILEKNKYIINISKTKNNIRAVVLLVSINKWSYLEKKCKEIELIKRKIRNLYNPKFKDINKQIYPLNKGISHNHIIHSIDFPIEFMPIYDIIDKYKLSKSPNNKKTNALTIAQLLTENKKKNIEL